MNEVLEPTVIPFQLDNAHNARITKAYLIHRENASCHDAKLKVLKEKWHSHHNVGNMFHHGYTQVKCRFVFYSTRHINQYSLSWNYNQFKQLFARCCVAFALFMDTVTGSATAVLNRSAFTYLLIICPTKL